MVQAYVLGKISAEEGNNAIKNLAGIDGVKSTDRIFGDYDFVLRAEAENEQTLGKLLLEGIRKVHGITATKTLVVAGKNKGGDYCGRTH